MIINSIKSKIILALCPLIGLLLLQSYLFNYSQTTLLNLQKSQHNALIQSEAVNHLENDIISLQAYAVSFIDNANENTITKFNFYLNKANLNLKQLKTNTLHHPLEYKNSLIRLGEYLSNYQDTFGQVVVNRQKREHLYTTQFKQPIDDLQVTISNLEESSSDSNKVIFNDVLLTISNLQHAIISYLYKPNFDEAQNVKQNLNHLHKKLTSTSVLNESLSSKTTSLKQAYNQLVLLTRSYTFSVNVVLTGIENELLYLTNEIKNIEKNKLTETEEQLSNHLTKNTEQANIFRFNYVNHFIFKLFYFQISYKTDYSAHFTT